MSEGKKSGRKKETSFADKLVKKIKSSKPVRIGIIAGSCVLVVLLGLWAYTASYDNVYHGVTVNGIDVGGMSFEEAVAEIESKVIEPMKTRTITLKCGENQKSVSALELVKGEVNAETIAKQAFEAGRSESDGMFVFASTAFGDTDVNAAIELDEVLLKEIVDEISASYSKDVVETSYTVEGDKLTVVRGKGGRLVNMTTAVEQVKKALFDAGVTEVVLVVEDAQPKTINADELYAEIAKPARDASYKKENGQIVIVEEEDGIEISKEELKKALSAGGDTFELSVKFTKPSKTASDLRATLFRDVMGEWSSDYSTSAPGRATNVELAASRINGTVLLPGEVFSYDQTIGPRTAANGYKSAGVYVGNKVESGIGGGICQPSSTLYGAVLYANLEIVERTSHSLPVAYVPKGQDATIAQGYIDFKFKNNTEYPVKIVATYAGRKLVCQIVGVKTEGQTVEVINSQTGILYPKVEKKADETIPKGYKKTVSKGANGFTTSSKRIVKMNGAVVKEEKLTNSRYNATNNEILVNPADTETDPGALIEYTDQVIEEEKAEEEATETEAETGSVTPETEEKTDESANQGDDPSIDSGESNTDSESSSGNAESVESESTEVAETVVTEE